MKYKMFIPENDNVPYLVVDFLNYLRAVKGKSPNTIEAYKIDLCLFFKFIKIHRVLGDKFDDYNNVIIHDVDLSFISNISLADIYAFINYISIVRNNGPHARARKTASIKSFYKYLAGKAKLITDNPAQELETPKINKSQPVYLTLNESKDLLKTIDGSYKERDYSIITLFLNCGLRLSELVNIDITDIKEDRLLITGKGNKQRIVYLNKVCLNSIADYLKFRLDIKVNSKALFLSERKNRISKRTVQYIVKKYIKKAELTENKYSVHKLRHTAATLMYKYGNVDIRTLQQILGHENVSTTQIYTHVDNEKLREAINSNPLTHI